ncbi:MAG: hypothetical protein ACR2QF_07015 [Geminicoccaceae bacterium]
MKITEGMGKRGEQMIIDMETQKITVWRLKTVPSASNTGEAYVVSGDDIWLPGIFDSRSAALVFGSMLTPEQQTNLWDEVFADGSSGAPEEDPILDIDDVCSILNERLNP